MKIAIGLGCDRGTPAATVAQCIAETVAACGLSLAEAAAVASIDLKADAYSWHFRHYSATPLSSAPARKLVR